MSFELPFSFPVGDRSLEGIFSLQSPEKGDRSYRKGQVSLKTGRTLEVELTHSEATQSFMYLSRRKIGPALSKHLKQIGLVAPAETELQLPGQFVLGADRETLTSQGVCDVMYSPAFQSLSLSHEPGEVAVFPVLREGMKYGLQSALWQALEHEADEIVVDAHHVADESVPLLGRRMELTLFKDKDLSEEERAAVKCAVIGDSVASGTVIIGLIDEIAARFPNLQRVELIAPLSAIYGLARIAAFSRSDIEIRIHCFETVVNALPPDFYFSPHYEEPEMHICPDAAKEVAEWWGIDNNGLSIGKTACSGFGWSEAFFNPGKQLRMIEEELRHRHQMGLGELFRRKIKPS